MGNYISSEEFKLEGYEQRRNLGHIWEDVGTKNFDYYNNKRFTKISRQHYPHLYYDGYFYGRYYNDEYYKKLGWIYNDKDGWVQIAIEREF